MATMSQFRGRGCAYSLVDAAAPLLITPTDSTVNTDGWNPQIMATASQFRGRFATVQSRGDFYITI